jgi:outer membrane protein OmpA-like peptidoglycan-associated protein
VLDTVVAIMLDNPNIIIEMSAHTDSKGKDAYNVKLSQRRAQSCVDYLISRGISTSRMIAKGYGKKRPIAPNTLPDGKDNPEGRQLNRRTEFKVLRVTQVSK